VWSPCGFEPQHRKVIQDALASGKSQAGAEERAESPQYYSGFFVPPAARWEHIHRELHQDVGTGLNKALAALEDENPALDGVLQHINFNRTIGRRSCPIRSCATSSSTSTSIACLTRTLSSRTCSGRPTNT
jgi:hypothetical protein